MDSIASAHSPTPNTASSTNSRKSNRFFLPLSDHGMPKTPLPKSPEGGVRAHRFSNTEHPLPAPHSPPMSPGSLMSPPMSAKSFGTFIDSEPSTPAYSPRMGSTWDRSTLVLLSPVSTAPSSPPEPKWDMMLPMKKAKKTIVKKKNSASLMREISADTSLSSHPVKPIQEESQKENHPPTGGTTATDGEDEGKTKEEESRHEATLEKLATRVKSMLRRKTVSEKKSERQRRGFQELDRMETVHWTEM